MKKKEEEVIRYFFPLLVRDNKGEECEKKREIDNENEEVGMNVTDDIVCSHSNVKLQTLHSLVRSAFTQFSSVYECMKMTVKEIPVCTSSR